MQQKSNLKTIVLFAPGPIGGAEKVILNGHRALVQKNPNIKLWIIKETRVPEVVRKFEQLASLSGILYTSFKSRKIFDLELYFKLKQSLKQEDPQVLHAHGIKAVFYAWLTKPKGTKLVVTHHGKTGHTLKVRIYEFIEGLILKSANGVIAVSNEMKRELNKSGIKNNKIYLVENLLTLKIPRKNIVRTPQLKIVYVGRLSPEKGCHVLIHSLKNLKIDYDLVIVGDGKERKNLEQLVSILGIEKMVHFVGFQVDVAKYLNVSNLLVMPSFREGQPLVLIEACCLGVPVIASNVGGIPELVKHGQNGFLFEPGDSNQLCELITKFAQEEFRVSFSLKSRQQEMLLRFAPETWALRTLNAYQKVIQV